MGVGRLFFGSLLLARDRVFHGGVLFEPDQLLYAILCRETGSDAFPVLGDALGRAFQIANVGARRAGLLRRSGQLNLPSLPPASNLPQSQTPGRAPR